MQCLRVSGVVVTLALVGIDTLPPARMRQAALGQWFTPPWLAREVVRPLAYDICDGRVLEPSAGDGAIVDAALWLGAAEVVAVEIDPVMCERLRERFAGRPVEVICADFLTLDIDPCFDAIVGNPPYDDGMDTDHLARIADYICSKDAPPHLNASLLLRTVALHSGGRFDRVWSRVRVESLAPCVDRVPFLAAGGEPADAGKIDVSVFRIAERRGHGGGGVRWLREGEVPR